MKDHAFLQRLISAYPKGLAARDGNGMLPLHIAALHSASPLLLKALLKAWPAAASERVAAPNRDYDGFLPLHLLCTNDGDVARALALLVVAYRPALAERFPPLPRALHKHFDGPAAGLLPAHAVARRAGQHASAVACVVDADPAAAAGLTPDRQTVPSTLPPCCRSAPHAPTESLRCGCAVSDGICMASIVASADRDQRTDPLAALFPPAGFSSAPCPPPHPVRHHTFSPRTVQVLHIVARHHAQVFEPTCSSLSALDRLASPPSHFA